MRAKLSYVVSRNSLASNVAVWLGIVAAIAVLSVPWWGSSALMRWAVEVVCYLLLAQMWNLMAGYAGLMSVGIQAFVGIGAYVLFIFAQHLGVHPFLAIPLGGVVAAIAALATSVVVFRMRGGYFAIGTWVLAEVFRIAFSNVATLGGGSGQSLTVMTHIERGARERGVYLIAAATLILVSVAINLLLRSRFGLGLMALRDSEDAAESQGVNVKALKLQVYALSSFGAGLVGAIYFTSIPYLTVRRFRSELGGRRDLHRRGRWNRHGRGTDRRHRHLLRAALGARRLRDLVLARHGRGRRGRHHVRAEWHLGLPPRALGHPTVAAATPARIENARGNGRCRDRVGVAAI
jgi:branched-chain amino acid transport system permease protein